MIVVLGHGRRQLLWFEVTRHPTAEWLARQITEAFPSASAPTYLLRDNDRAFESGTISSFCLLFVILFIWTPKSQFAVAKEKHVIMSNTKTILKQLLIRYT